MGIYGICHRIKELRKSKGYTQEKMAELLGISTRGYQKYESLESVPRLEIVVKMAELYDVSLDYLLLGKTL